MTRDQILAAHERRKVNEIWKRHNAFAESYYFLKRCIKENVRMGDTVLTLTFCLMVISLMQYMLVD